MKESDIDLSICMITYNHESTIADAIQGVLSQVLNKTFELVIGEDCSSDNTRDICEAFAIANNNVRLLPAQGNLGMHSNFKRTVDACKGKYVAFCEGDDFWTDTLKLQKQLDFLEVNTDYGLVHTDFDTLYMNDNYLMSSTHDKLGVKLEGSCSLKYWNSFGKSKATIKTLTVCFRKEYLQKYYQFMASDHKDWAVGDFPLFFFISSISKIGYLSDSTAVYRTVPAGTASSAAINSDKHLYIRKSYVEMRKYLLTNLITEKYDYLKAYHREYKSLLISAIISGNKTHFFKILNKTDLMRNPPLLFRLAYHNDTYVFNNITVIILRLYQRINILLYFASKPKFVWDTAKRKWLRH